MRRRVDRHDVSLTEAQANLSSLVARASAGEEITIMTSGHQMARLVQMRDRTLLRVPGQGRGGWHVVADFDAPLSSDFCELPE